jgi:hypothetical protein
VSRRLPGLCIAVALAACGGDDEDAARSAGLAARDVRIVMERTPCFGRCPVYSVELDGTGRVLFEGKGFVEQTGRHEAQVPARDVQDLARRMETAGWFGLRDSYPPDATDHASVITSLTVDGRTHRIEHNLGSRAAPQVLTDLEQSIDSVARTARWLGAQPAPAPGRGSALPPDSSRR